MSSATMLKKLVTLLAERRLAVDTPLDIQRAAMEQAVAKTPLAPEVTVTTLTLATRPCERFEPSGSRGPHTILYFHGGGYVLGSLASIRPFASYLAAATNRTVVTLDYRLAPEHPYPAAVHDAQAAYRALRHTHHLDPSQIVLAGDSAGGGLVLSTLMALRDDDTPLPAAGVCLSPWTDLTLTAASLHTNAATDPQITVDGLSMMARHYCQQADPKTPGISPRFGHFDGLPPLLIQVGDAEGLLDDSVLVAAQAKNAGVGVTLDVWPKMIHVWQAFAPRFPPAMDALAKIGAWLDQLELNG